MSTQVANDLNEFTQKINKILNKCHYSFTIHDLSQGPANLPLYLMNIIKLNTQMKNSISTILAFEIKDDTNIKLKKRVSTIIISYKIVDDITYLLLDSFTEPEYEGKGFQSTFAIAIHNGCAIRTH